MNRRFHVSIGMLLLGWPLLAALADSQEPVAGKPVPVRERLAQILGRIEHARLDASVRTLAGFGTRHVLSRTDSDTEGTGAARRWLQRQFEECVPMSGGRLQVTLQSETVPCVRPGMPKMVPIVNVIATLPGTTDPERIYVVSGHYDSRNGRGEDGVGAAPGAVDDASGTAIALEACRVLCSQQFPATIVFVAYDGEEQGLLGSQAHAASLLASGAKVDGMLGCDIVGNTLGMDGVRHDRYVRCFSYAPTGNDSLGRSLARAVTAAAATHVPEFGVKLIFRGDRYGRGGDHRSFFTAGFPAVRLSEPREDFTRQHQNVVERDGKPYGDLPESADPVFMANVARVVVATLAELALAPRAPLVFSAQLRRDRYDTEVVFELPAGTTDCEFLWRETTAPDWTSVIDRATARIRPGRNARSIATLPSVCLDDVVVGVRSIGADGSRSRVTTPPEPDRFDLRQQAEGSSGDSKKGGR